MRWPLLLIGLLFFTFLPARAGHSPPKIILHVNVQTTGEGMSPQEATTIAIPPDGEQVQIRTLPEVTEEEIIDVQQDAVGVHLQFNHVGQVDLDAVTAQNQGRMLVITIDGYVVYAPIIDEQITDGRLIIPRQLSPQIIQLLQDVAKENVRQAAKS